jgi:hypothetical protein
MTPNYRSRIVALIGGIQIELARWRRRCPGRTEVRLLTRGLSCQWWQENTITSKQTITPRWSPPLSAEALRGRANHALKCKLGAAA